MPLDDPAVLLERLVAVPAAEPLTRALADAGVEVYLVGGAVRDLMLGRPPRELDLLVEDDLAPLLDRLGADAREHDRFGTATVSLDGFVYDVARARTETYAHPGALPDVRPASVEEDLGRRDFTINAMALGLSGGRRGELREFGPARDDLRQGLVRVLHDASFRDDPTRLLRMARYASRLGFEVEAQTAELAHAAVDDGALATVSGSRLGNELRLAAAEPERVAQFEALHELGIDEALEPGFGLSDPARARAALALLPPDGDPATLVLASASSELSESQLAEFLNKLAFESSQRDAILAAATGWSRMAGALARATRPSQIAVAVGGAGAETVALAGASGAEEAARRWIGELRHVRPDIDGHDLLAAGVEAGPRVGEGLRAALAAKLDGEAPTREQQLSEALRAAGAGR